MQIATFEQNVLLYLYSTAPQVLGAILALIGLFHTLRMERFKNKIFSIGRKIMHELYSDEYREAIYINTDDGVNLANKWIDDSRIRLRSILEEESITGFEIWIEEYRVNINNQYDESSLKSVILGFVLLDFNRASYIIDSLNNIKSITARLFIYNGIVLSFFIVSFLFLHNYTISWEYFRFGTILGVVVAVSSLYSMIGYIYGSISNEYKGGFFFNPIREIKAKKARKARIKKLISVSKV